MMIFPQVTTPVACTLQDLEQLDMLAILQDLPAVKGDIRRAQAFCEAFLCADRAELEKRQQVIQCLMAWPDAERDLAGLIARADALVQLVRRLPADRTGGLLPYYTTGYWALDAYRTLIGELRRFLEPGEDPLFAGARQALVEMTGSAPHRALEKAADTLTEKGLLLTGLTVGVNVNAFWDTEDFGIIRFNPEEEDAPGLLSAAPGDAVSVSGMIRYPRVGPLLQLEAHFRAAYERKYRQPLQAMARLLDGLDFTAVEAFAARVQSLELYRSALHTIGRLRPREIPLCVPDYRGEVLSMEGMVYPHMALTQGAAAPVTAALNRGGMALITGANHSGKTSFLRAAAQCVLLAHLGFPVPARRFATPVFARVMSLFSAGEENFSNKSRFQLELEAIRGMREQAGADTLILFNEPFTSTNPDEAVDILAENLQALAQRGATQMVVTHFYEVYRLLDPNRVKSLITRTEYTKGALCYHYDLVESEPLAQNYAHMIAQQYALTAEDILTDPDMIRRVNRYLGKEAHHGA